MKKLLGNIKFYFNLFKLIVRALFFTEKRMRKISVYSLLPIEKDKQIVAAIKYYAREIRTLEMVKANDPNNTKLSIGKKLRLTELRMEYSWLVEYRNRASDMFINVLSEHVLGTQEA